ncbi:MAG: hypothetical protein KBT07_01915 [Clostridiales bacterium]|nr:hypothetical protein [Candidatus Scatonaster coprocaballi]
MKRSLKVALCVAIPVVIIGGFYAYGFHRGIFSTGPEGPKWALQPTETTTRDPNLDYTTARFSSGKEYQFHYVYVDQSQEENLDIKEYGTDKIRVHSYSKYVNLVDQINEQCGANIGQAFEQESNMILFWFKTSGDFSVCCDDQGTSIYLETFVDYAGSENDPANHHKYVFVAIPVDEAVGTVIDNSMEMAYKPIIYLYPEEETNIQVSLGAPDRITCSYPKYSEGWNVLAKPNGDLIDLATGRSLYSLYYECENEVKFKKEKDGFIVKGEDAAAFLEEKLAILGLSDREAEEFIVYWLPILEANPYNYIRFATLDEINRNMPLQFSQEPDSLIRVLMVYEGLEEPIEVEEQILETPERNGFVVVEWGGTEILE